MNVIIFQDLRIFKLHRIPRLCSS